MKKIFLQNNIFRNFREFILWICAKYFVNFFRDEIV